VRLLKLQSRAFEDLQQQREHALAAHACAFGRCARSGFIFIFILLFLLFFLPAVGWVAAARTRTCAFSCCSRSPLLRRY
jgi:hypothetical protein